MEIIISRHARRRLQLYSIDEADVIAALKHGAVTAKKTGTRGLLIDEAFADKYEFPLKIVFEREQAKITIITAYPLKKGAAR